MIKHYAYAFILALASGVLFIFGWQNPNYTFLLFFFLVPLFILLNSNRIKGHLFFIYIALFIAHSGTALWIYETNRNGAIGIFLINPLLFILPFILYQRYNKSYNSFIPEGVFISSWLSVEFFHHNWELAFPYITIGNGLGSFPQIIQWYEYTGVLRGSLWILSINAILFFACRQVYERKTITPVLLVCVLSLLLSPLLISLYLSNKSIIAPTQKVEVVAVHTNTDCRNFKYKVAPKKLSEHYLKTTMSHITNNTSFVIWPETAIVGTYWISDNVKEGKLLRHIIDTISSVSPNANLISGIFLSKIVPKKDYYTLFDKKHKVFCHEYNGAINIDPNETSFEYRSKQKLVPLEEYTPYPIFMRKLKKTVKSLGGFSFFYEKEDGKIFTHKKLGIKTAMIICYESLFGEEITKYTKNGAQILFMGLNEGWYKNVTTATHFNNFARIRSIENRKYVIRSSNDGISSIIDTKGNILKKLSDFKPGAIRIAVYPNKKITFYAKYGDYIGRFALVVLGLLMSVSLIRKVNYNFGSTFKLKTKATI